jgi:tetratricopeptide (TPR) repeat protein
MDHCATPTSRPAARALAAVALTLAACAASAQTFNACGDLANAFGPHDYRKDRGEPLQLVEGAHFKPMVESLIRGQTSAHPGQDIDYTLRAFPNHHRALVSAMRLAEREKTPRARGMNYTVECYFDRAIRWQPNDLTVRMIFANYLTTQKKPEEARAQLAYVVARSEDNPFTHYNVGLLYFDLKDYDAALAQAHKAMAMGFTRTELRDKLQSAGKWSEPAAAGAASPAPSAASSAASSPASAASAVPARSAPAAPAQASVAPPPPAGQVADPRAKP